LTDPSHLKSAAEYLVEFARSSKGGPYGKLAKIDALGECREEILEAHRSGISRPNQKSAAGERKKALAGHPQVRMNCFLFT
jgi:hypothetical protein